MIIMAILLFFFLSSVHCDNGLVVGDATHTGRESLSKNILIAHLPILISSSSVVLACEIFSLLSSLSVSMYRVSKKLCFLRIYSVPADAHPTRLVWVALPALPVTVEPVLVLPQPANPLSVVQSDQPVAEQSDLAIPRAKLPPIDLSIDDLSQ